MINIASILDISARRCPEATAFVHRDRRTGFGELERLASRIANGLVAEGFGPGSRIALCSQNRIAVPAAYFGILKTGATVVMINAHATRRDIDQGLRDSGAEALLCQTRLYGEEVPGAVFEAFEANEGCRRLWLLPETLEPDPAASLEQVCGYPTLARLMQGRSDRFETAAVAPDDVAVIAFTSGTTGRRKAVQTMHRNIAAMVMITAQLGPAEDCRVRVTSNTLDCLMGQVYMLVSPVYMGHCVVLLDDDDPLGVLGAVLRWGGTYLIDSPIAFDRMLEVAGQVDCAAIRRTLRICVTGGAGMAKDLSERFEATFGAPLLPGYGATETTTAITWTCPGDSARPGSVGRPIPGVTVRVLDPEGRPCPAGEAGEVWVRSPGIMKGYLDMPEATERTLVEGWYRTSDLGHLGEDGSLYVHRRLDNKIIQGIDQIDPLEVESILLEHPAIHEARVVAEPDPRLGQRARSFVVLENRQRADQADLLGWLQSELPYGKAPETLEIVATLPAGGAASPITRRI